MWNPTTVAVLLLASLVRATAGNEVISVIQLQTSSCAERQTTGLFCESCSTVAICLKIDNVWTSFPLESCNANEGLYCNEYDGGCSTSPSSCNLGGEDVFECNTPGVIPNPYNCRLYHMCFMNGNNLVAINMHCGAGAFSPATGDCSLLSNDTICLEPQFNCSHLGQMAAWPGNSNIYYICVADLINDNRVLRPRMFRCPPNHIFQNLGCVQRNWENLPPGESEQFDCQRPGLFRDPANCRYYYSCNNELVAQHLKCPDGTFFNPSTLSCVLGIC